MPMKVLRHLLLDSTGFPYLLFLTLPFVLLCITTVFHKPPLILFVFISTHHNFKKKKKIYPLFIFRFLFKKKKKTLLAVPVCVI